MVNGTTTHTYVTQNGKVVRETIGTGATAKVLDFIYDQSGQPFALKYSTNGGANFETYYYVLNLHGDVVMPVNAAGKTKATYRYNAWGALVYSFGDMASVNPLRYRGYYYDTETGFYYLQSRYYDPAICRFINADIFASTGQGFTGTNMFAYCNNCPVCMSDASGKCSTLLFGLIKIDCEKVSCETSDHYNPEASKIAILYDGRTSGYIGGAFGGKGFKSQAQAYVTSFEGSYNVEDYSFCTIEGFIDSWNQLEGEYDKIFIFMHGYPGGLSCNGKTISNSGRADYKFTSLETAHTNLVYLFSCNGATVSAEADSVAKQMSYLTGGGTVWAVANGSVGYAIFGCIPQATNGGSWSVTRRSATYIP